MKSTQIKTIVKDVDTFKFIDLEIGDIFIPWPDSETSYTNLRVKTTENSSTWLFPIDIDRANDELQSIRPNDRVYKVATIEIKISYVGEVRRRLKTLRRMF